jgi:hypothetical protein
MPRRSSLPYDTTNLSSLLDPYTVPTGKFRTVIKLLHSMANYYKRYLCF